MYSVVQKKIFKSDNLFPDFFSSGTHREMNVIGQQSQHLRPFWVVRYNLEHTACCMDAAKTDIVTLGEKKYDGLIYRDVTHCSTP